MWGFKVHVNAQKQVGIASVLLICLSGCATFNGSQGSSGILPVGLIVGTSTIAAIKQAPSMNAIVQVKGQVGASVPLLGKTAYELHDGTGSLWVIANDAIPNAGDEVTLEGKLLYQTIAINGKEQGSLYLEQQRQLQRTPALKSDRGTPSSAS